VLYDCRESSPGYRPESTCARQRSRGTMELTADHLPPEPNAIATTGYSYFIYERRKPSGCTHHSRNKQLRRAVSPGHRSKAANGTNYGPHFVANWTVGAAATSSLPATSMFYYTLDTFWPYGQVILRSIEGPLPPKKPTPPTCKGTTCT
jgi:hypothetical protein